jgi:hypothetical protein
VKPLAKILNNVPLLDEESLSGTFLVDPAAEDDSGCIVYDGCCTGADGKCSIIDCGCKPPQG